MHSLNKLLFPSFKSLALFSLSLGFLGLSPCLLSAATLDDLQFTLINNDTEYSVSAKDPKTISGAVTIPATYDGKPVTKIVAFGFGVPDSEADRPDITSIDLSQSSIVSIQENAFRNCTALTSINFPDTLTSIGHSAFYFCRSLTSIDLSNTALTFIEEKAFSECTSLTSIDLPDTLTSIKNSAFFNCTSLTSIDLSNTALTSIGNSAFIHCLSLASIDFPDGLTSIGDSAFYYCESLTSIDFPDALTSIGHSAFSNCTSLVSIDLSNTAITSIQDLTFSDCTSLTSIDFPDTLTSIKDKAFRDCRKLAAITFQGSAPSLEGDSIFLNTGSDVGGFTITIYKEHEASYASWRDAYTFNVIDNPITGPVILVLQTHYDPSNQAFSIITKGEDSASNVSLQHTANLGDAWATLNTLTYSKVSDSTNDTITRTVTLDPSTQSTGFYRLVSE